MQESSIARNYVRARELNRNMKRGGYHSFKLILVVMISLRTIIMLHEVTIFDKNQPHVATNGGISGGSSGTTSPREVELTHVQILARQLLSNETRPKPLELTLGAFIHIGKTGGSSLSGLLRYGCHSFMFRWGTCNKAIQNESALSNLTTYYHVPDFHARTKDDGLFGKKGRQHEFYLFTVRDPLDRTISAYLYDHPRNKVEEYFQNFQKTEGFTTRREKLGSNEAVRNEFIQNFNDYKVSPGLPKISILYAKDNKSIYTCAPTLEDFAVLLDEHDRSSCAKKVQNILNTPISTIAHLRFDYTYIAQNLHARGALSNKTVLVTRMEHLNKDWVRANRYLGQEHGEIMLPDTNVRDSKTVERPITAKLSEDSRKKLCMALQKEYAVYFGMLSQAVNLEPDDIAASLAVSQKNCPWLDFSSLPKSIDEVFG